MDRTSKKKTLYQKTDFQDQQIYQEIRDQIRQIRQSNLNDVQKQQKIYNLYVQHKQNKKRRKMMEKGNDKKFYNYQHKGEIQSQSGDQPGQINQQQPKKRQKQDNEQQLSHQSFGQLIKQVTLTRKKLIDFLDNRRFEDLVKGCFVRYRCDKSSKDQSYIIAQIIGVKQGNKQYTLTSNQKTKILLVCQQSSIKVVDLPIQMISNQAISGSIQINNWVSQNTNKIPKQRQIKQKLQQHNRLLTQQLSSQQIDKNILNRAVAISKGQQQIKSLQDLQNLLDFIQEKYEGYELLEQQQAAKRKQEKLELIQLRRKKYEYQQVLKSLQAKKKQYLESKGINQKGEKQKMKSQKLGGQGLKIQQKREDSIRQKCRLREMLLCTAEGYEKIRINVLQNHAKFDFQFDL